MSLLSFTEWVGSMMCTSVKEKKMSKALSHINDLHPW